MNKKRTALVTGSCGLIGSEVTRGFAQKNFQITGIDSNHRSVFFGPEGDTRWALGQLQSEISDYQHFSTDIRDREAVLRLIDELKPDLIIHTAAQPSHDRAAAIPFLDFEVNALGTLHLLEAARRSCPESPFIMAIGPTLFPLRNWKPDGTIQTQFLNTELMRISQSTRASIRFSVLPNLQQTLWSRSTVAILGCQPAVSAVVASPVRIIPG